MFACLRYECLLSDEIFRVDRLYRKISIII